MARNIIQKRYLSTSEVADLVGTTSQSIINWCKENRFEFTRIGKGPRRISTESLRDYLISKDFVVEGFTDTPLDYELRPKTFTGPEGVPAAKPAQESKPLTEEEAKEKMRAIAAVFNVKTDSLSKRYDNIVKIVQS